MDNATDFAQRLRENAANYFADFDGQPVQVKLLWTQRRWSCHLFRYALTSAARRHVVFVKAPIPRRTVANGLPASTDRPRLKPLTHVSVKYQYEFAALSAIDEHFTRLDDARFGSVRMLDLLSDARAIVMEEVPYPTLRSRLLKLHRLKARQLPMELKSVCRNAGAWLKAYHHLPAIKHTLPRHVRLEDFNDGVLQFTNYLAHCVGRQRLFDNVATALTDTARRTLPEVLPLGMGHGDFAPRNIFVAPDARVTVFDTLARWRVPIYEDLASFAVALNTSAARVYSRGLWFHGRLLKQCMDELYRGYFAGRDIPTLSILLFELQALLNRWSSLAAAQNAACGLGRLAKGLRLSWEGDFYARYAKCLLADIERLSGKKLQSRNSNLKTPPTRSEQP